MKKGLLIISLLFTYTLSNAQDVDCGNLKQQIEELTKQKAAIDAQLSAAQGRLDAKCLPKWRKSGFIGLNIGQASLINWAAGGYSNVSVGLVGHYQALYKSGNHQWENFFDGRYGMIKNWDYNNGTEEPMRKNEDLINITSKYSYNLSKSGKFSASALADFRSQFTSTQNENNLTISSFMSPGYLTLAPGLEYRPKQYLSFFIAPAMGKFTFVIDDESVLFDNGDRAYGVKKGQHVRPEFGGQITTIFTKQIVKNASIYSKLDLFGSYYLDKDTRYDEQGKSRLGNIDVNWQTDIVVAVTKFINVSLSNRIVYDDDIHVTDKFGKTGPRTQFREALGVGIGYKF